MRYNWSLLNSSWTNLLIVHNYRKKQPWYFYGTSCIRILNIRTSVMVSFTFSFVWKRICCRFIIRTLNLMNLFNAIFFRDLVCEPLRRC